MQAVFVTYRCPVGCSFWVKHRADASPSARCRPAVERKAELSARRPAPLGQSGQKRAYRGRFRKRNLKHAKECSIQQRRGFACGVCRWKRRFGCSRNSAVSAARFESGFRERDGQGQHWRGPHSHGGFLKMIVCESGGHANGLTYFIFRFLRRPPTARFERVGKGAGRATSRKRRHGPPARSSAVRVFEWRGGEVRLAPLPNRNCLIYKGQSSAITYTVSHLRGCGGWCKRK